jgi:D-sedoheptulose 7-phosphate isomerase
MKHIELCIQRYPALEVCREAIEKTVDMICSMYRRDGKLLLCGNGGSAADCEHISGELLKGFLLLRKPLTEEVEGLRPEIAAGLQRGIQAIPLTSLSALSTAFGNDVAPENTFAQAVFALGSSRDVFFGISTSGNAENVCRAAEVARKKGLPTIALTGEGGGRLAPLCDVAIRVPAKETYQIQEYHLPVYHALCAQVEEDLFGGN